MSITGGPGAGSWWDGTVPRRAVHTVNPVSMGQGCYSRCRAMVGMMSFPRFDFNRGEAVVQTAEPDRRSRPVRHSSISPVLAPRAGHVGAGAAGLAGTGWFARRPR